MLIFDQIHFNLIKQKHLFRGMLFRAYLPFLYSLTLTKTMRTCLGSKSKYALYSKEVFNLLYISNEK